MAMPPAATVGPRSHRAATATPRPRTEAAGPSPITARPPPARSGALHAIAHRLGLDLASTLQERFGIDYPEDLGIGQASELIDSLKASGAPR